MALTIKNQKKQNDSSADSFYNYIKKIHSETTVNGSEVKQKLSWYKKVLGLL